MSAFELAQLNIGVIKAPMDSPVMAEFARNLERINALAEQAPGFVWRLQTDDGDATAIRPFDQENMLVNMSVWRDVESLNKYVYASPHVEFMRRRREWFERMDEAFLVLWWLPAGQRPSVEEAIAKLGTLRARGPTADAFTFRHAFPPPDAAPMLKDMSEPDEVRKFPLGRFEIVHVGGVSFGRATYLPGWKWSQHNAPLAGTTLCHAPHTGVVLSGHGVVLYEGGVRVDLLPGQAFHITSTPHDSWVEGNEPYVSLHVLSTSPVK